jgi:hypothetical protein
MTYQEILWQNKLVWVVSLLSRSGKIHRYLKPYIGRGGLVVGEAKNGMLLIEFGLKKELRAIPAGCVIKYVDVSAARKPNGKIKHD